MIALVPDLDCALSGLGVAVSKESFPYFFFLEKRHPERKIHTLKTHTTMELDRREEVRQPAAEAAETVSRVKRSAIPPVTT